MRIHPAILLLLRFQGVARIQRLKTRLLAPRRLLLTLLASGLAVLWLGNAALSIVLREPWSPEVLRQALGAGLLAYACWHLLKLVYSRPEAGIEWTPAEEALLGASPLARRDLVLYRMLTIAGSGVLKAGIFTLLMLPDLPVPPAGFIGTLLALLFLDLLRTSFEIVAWGVSDRQYQRLRIGVVLVAASAGVSTLVIAASSSAVVGNAGSAGGFKIVAQVFGALGQLADTPVGRLAQAPFVMFVNVMLTKHVDLRLGGWLAAAVGLVVAAGCVTLWLDRHLLRGIADRERAAYNGIRRGDARATRSLELRLHRVGHWHGIGALVWRQLLGARRHASSLAFALALPAALSCLPWLAGARPASTLFNVTGALAFYSFLLLPAALKFDFQRDLERMALIKSLPASPLAVVCGQLAIPVAIASLLQFAVLAATVVTQRANPGLALCAWLLLVTLNVIIFGLDNLVFLWFPHRLKQEGLFIFLRTTLVFTAKGLLFAAALAVVFAWVLIASLLARHSGMPLGPMFAAGVWILMLASACVLIRLLTSAFDRFDPSLDLPE